MSYFEVQATCPSYEKNLTGCVCKKKLNQK
jgi:hypothetical protein